MITPLRSSCALAVALALSACAAPPVRETEVQVLKAGDLPPEPGLPPPGTTWRLDPDALAALSPAPYVWPPSPPVPPPRIVPVPVLPHPYAWDAPFYGPYYGPAFGFSFGYFGSRHPHRRRWR